MGKWKNALTGPASAAAAVLLIVALLIISIEMFALDENFYKNEYQKLDTADDIGISEEGLAAVTHKLIAYTRGALPGLDMRETIGGETREVFGAREKEHMVDVRALYLAARDVRTGALIGVAVLFAFVLAAGRREALPTLCRSFLAVSAVFVVVVGAAGLWAAVDFASFWTSFHQVFFTNDLWILDPRTDVLIMMVPQQFFSDLVARIIIRFVSIFATLNAAAALGRHHYNKRAGENRA